MWSTWNSAAISVLLKVLLLSLFLPSTSVLIFTSPVSSLFHQFVSGWPRLQAPDCPRAAQQQTPVGFLPRGRNWVRDEPRGPRQRPLSDGRQVMSSTLNTFHNTHCIYQPCQQTRMHLCLGLVWTGAAHYSTCKHVRQPITNSVQTSAFQRPSGPRLVGQ